jgi:hypothetical protein
MCSPAEPGMEDLDDQQARRWLSALRTGSPDEKAEARRNLAEILEARGSVSEAVDLLVANAREGHRDAELFQALARMYHHLGDEYLAASAALEATRLSGRQPSNNRAGRHAPSHGITADVSDARPDPRPSHARREPSQGAYLGAPPVWRLPLRVAGWIAVLASLIAAGAVASEHPASGALYLASAIALGLMLIGSGPARQFARLPGGPLGDGALLFFWLFALLAAGALLPRPFTLSRPAEPPTEVSAPSAVRTPSPAPSVSPTP